MDPELGPLKKWKLIRYRDKSESMRSIIQGSEADLVFFPEGRLAGSGGCNRFIGSFESSGHILAIGPIGTTLMYCDDPPGLMAQESDYLSRLELSTSYEIEGEKLRFFDDEGHLLLEFILSHD